MKRIALISFPLALVIAAACQEGVVNPTDDASLVPGPRFAKWTAGSPGCAASAGVKFQLTKGDPKQLSDGFSSTGLMVTGTSGDDTVDCAGSLLDITFAGGDGDDIFIGGTGSDHMSGGDGDDFLNGRDDVDTAVGGEGTDTCIAETVIGCEIIP